MNQLPHHDVSDVSVGAIIVVVIGYSLLAAALYMEWQLQSSAAVLMIALMICTLTVVLCADFSLFKAAGGGFTFEARRKLKRAAQEIQEVVDKAA